MSMYENLQLVLAKEGKRVGAMESPSSSDMAGDPFLERRRHSFADYRRPPKRKLQEEEGGGAEVAALRAELEEERAAAASGASEAMAVILRLQREKGLLLMEMRQFRQLAEEKMAYQDQQLRALSGDLRVARRHLLLHHGRGDEEDDEDDDLGEGEITETRNLWRKVEALEAEIKKISGRRREEGPPSSSSSAMTRRNPLHGAWLIKIFRRQIAEMVPQWVLSLSLACRKKIGAAGLLLFVLLALSRLRRLLPRKGKETQFRTCSWMGILVFYRGQINGLLTPPTAHPQISQHPSSPTPKLPPSAAAAAAANLQPRVMVRSPAFRGVLSGRLLCSRIGFKRPKKRIRKKKAPLRRVIDDEKEEGGSRFDLKSTASYRSHCIQPLGNLLLQGGDPSASNIRNRGLGSLRALSDELVLDILSLLDAPDLARLAAVSRSLYVFSTHDPLWRPLVLRHCGGDFLFSGGSWRSTYVHSRTRGAASENSGVRIRGFYSDYLFQSWLCANLEMKREWLSRDNIPRRRGISVAEFVSSFEEPNRPVLLEGCIADWPAISKWDPQGLARICGEVKLAAGPVEMTVENFFRYSAGAREERPLYLFDPKFADKVPALGSDYSAPRYFAEDLFSLLGAERPDYRWIIAGPAGSGSSFHVDPNATSAWNAVIRGAKKWVMFPPEVVPPGVHPSADGAEVACPVSIAEWFINFYGACRDWKRRPVECVCRAGEVVFVPSGWWHLVLNLEDSVAVTQNYVGRRNLLKVLEFLRRPNAEELVSGTRDRVNLHDKFRRAVESSFPGLIDELQMEGREKMKKVAFWDSVSDANTGGFKFSF